ncbi:MAG: hypothetical protein ACSLE0_09115 [Chitinophagaceae bacterium]
MKKLMMKYLMISCNEATLLMAKKEEGKLSFLSIIKLSWHTSMCVLCKKFEKQSRDIAKEAKHVQAEEELPFFTREKIGRLLEPGHPEK